MKSFITEVHIGDILMSKNPFFTSFILDTLQCKYLSDMDGHDTTVLSFFKCTFCLKSVFFHKPVALTHLLEHCPSHYFTHS